MNSCEDLLDSEDQLHSPDLPPPSTPCPLQPVVPIWKRAAPRPRKPGTRWTSSHPNTALSPNPEIGLPPPVGGAVAPDLALIYYSLDSAHLDISLEEPFRQPSGTVALSADPRRPSGSARSPWWDMDYFLRRHLEPTPSPLVLFSNASDSVSLSF